MRALAAGLAVFLVVVPSHAEDLLPLEAEAHALDDEVRAARSEASVAAVSSKVALFSARHPGMSDLPRLRYELALAWRGLDRCHEALAAVEPLDGTTSVLLLRAALDARLGNMAEARALVGRAVERRDRDGDRPVTLDLASQLERSGDFETALTAYELVLDEDASPDLVLSIARCRVGLDRTDAALLSAFALLERPGATPSTAIAVLDLCDRAGRLAEAPRRISALESGQNLAEDALAIVDLTKKKDGLNLLRVAGGLHSSASRGNDGRELARAVAPFFARAGESGTLALRGGILEGDDAAVAIAGALEPREKSLDEALELRLARVEEERAALERALGHPLRRKK